MKRAGVILAAGMGTRMKSALPKVMHQVAGFPILGHVVRAMRGAGVERIVVVSAPDAESVRAFAKSLDAESVVQEEQLGTGHAAACAKDALKDFKGAVVVSYGDHPLLTASNFNDSFAAREKGGMSLVAFEPRDPAMYGRVITDSDGFVARMVEYKDASEKDRAITLCNAGIIAADAQSFFRWASALENNNAQQEYYLTDVPLLAKREGVRCAVARASEIDVMGVNSRAELAAAEAQMQARLRMRALEAGVGLVAPETVFMSYDTVLEADAKIGPYVVFAPGVTVRSGAEIRPFSHLEGAEVASGAIVGPFARLRPGAKIDADVHIGNFVEVKNAHIERGAKANHLAYLGDAHVGAGANIGAGTITCNYDGFDKHFTDIGAGAFIGSNSSLVAPVKIGDGSYVGAGSVITKETAKDSLAVTRAAQKEVSGWAESFRTRKKSEKAKKGKGK